MHLDWTVTLGSLIEFGALALSVYLMLRQMRREQSQRLERLERAVANMNLKVDYLWAWFAHEHNFPSNGEIAEGLKRKENG